MNPTTHQLLFAIIVLMACLTVAMLTRRPSVKASIQRQRDEWARSGGTPDHAWIDDSASFSANVVSFLWSALGVYLAVAIIMGNLLWVVTLFP